MEELLHDKDAVTHWLRFMRIQRAEHFLRFWLDAESFKASASSRLCSQNVHQSHSLQSATSLCDNGSNCDTTEATSEVLVTNQHCNNVDVEPTQQSSANSHEQHSKFKHVPSAPDCSTSHVSPVRTINKSNASADTSRSSGALESHSCGTGSGTPHRSSEVGEVPPILNDICAASSVNSATTDSGPITQDQPSAVTAQTSGVKVQPSQNIPTEVKAQLQSKLKEERANLQLKLLKSRFKMREVRYICDLICILMGAILNTNIWELVGLPNILFQNPIMINYVSCSVQTHNYYYNVHDWIIESAK